jgi:hypothetical protein
MYTLYTLFFAKKEIHNVCLNAYSIQSIMKNKECVIRVHVFLFFTDVLVQLIYIIHCIKSYCFRANEKFCSECAE